MAVLGFDVGGSSVKFAVVDEDGKILRKGNFTTPKSLENFYAEIKKVGEDCKKNFKIVGAGFSLPGAVDNESGIIGGSSAIDYIHNFNIKSELKKILSLPVEMENDANCAALGEVWIGSAKDFQDVAFLVIGTGVGGAIVKDKKIHRGKHFHGGEFGYMLVDEGFEILSWTGATGGMSKKIAEEKNLPKDEMNGKKAFELLEQGDEVAKNAIEKMYMNLARGIYNIQYCFDPEIFVIGGAISERSDFIEKVDEKIKIIIDKVKVAKIIPKVVRCKFGNDANIFGAVYNFKTLN